MSLKQALGNRPTLGTSIPPFTQFNKQELDLLTRNFGAVTPENSMKPMFVQPAEGRFDFTECDALVGDARARNLHVNGHALVWHLQTPDWFFSDHGKPAGRDLLLARMRAHIAAVAGHFAGKVKSWDVVNEAIDEGNGYLRPSPWLAGIGGDYIAEAFLAAHQADPMAELYYNDYGIEMPAKREKAIRLIRELKSRKVAIHGIGIQGHWQLDRIPFKELEEAILAFHAEGLPVMITELDIDVVTEPRNPSSIGLPDEFQTRLADQYARLFALFLKHRDKITRVTFWGLHDGRSWLNHNPSERTSHPLLWDRNLQPKPALWAVLALAQERRAKP